MLAVRECDISLKVSSSPSTSSTSGVCSGSACSLTTLVRSPSIGSSDSLLPLAKTGGNAVRVECHCGGGAALLRDGTASVYPFRTDLLRAPDRLTAFSEGFWAWLD